MRKKAVELKYMNSPLKLTYHACSLLSSIPRAEKYKLLEIDDLEPRMEKCLELLTNEANNLKN